MVLPWPIATLVSEVGCWLVTMYPRGCQDVPEMY